MTTYLSLDLSKACTGWAIWDDRSGRPYYGHWQLGSEYTANDGEVFARLHRSMGDLYKQMPFENLYYEEPLNPGQLTGATNIRAISLAFGLAAHAQSFGFVKRCRMIKAVNVEKWRKGFIGDMVVHEVKAGVRAQRKAGFNVNATDKLKRLTIERCQQLGFITRKNDEADAIGILTYSVALDGVTPPWLAHEVLRPPLGEAA